MKYELIEDAIKQKKDKLKIYELIEESKYIVDELITIKPGKKGEKDKLIFKSGNVFDIDKCIKTDVNIFKELLTKKIPFSFIVNNLQIGAEFGKDYFITALSSDVSHIFEFTASDSIKNLSEYDISLTEYNILKSDYMHLFNKVKHSKDGRVYELISMPFKRYFDLKK